LWIYSDVSINLLKMFVILLYWELSFEVEWDLRQKT